MVTLLPDIVAELDHNIDVLKESNSKMEAENQDLSKKINSVDMQVYTLQRMQN